MSGSDSDASDDNLDKVNLKKIVDKSYIKAFKKKKNKKFEGKSKKANTL